MVALAQAVISLYTTPEPSLASLITNVQPITQLLPLTAHSVMRRVHCTQALQQIKVIIPLAVLLCRTRKPRTWQRRAPIRRDLLTFLERWRRVEGPVQAAFLCCFTTPSGRSRVGASPAPVVGLSPESSVCGFNKQATLHPGNL